MMSYRTEFLACFETAEKKNDDSKCKPQISFINECFWTLLVKVRVSRQNVMRLSIKEMTFIEFRDKSTPET